MTPALLGGRGAGDGRPAALGHLDRTVRGGQEVGTPSPGRRDLRAHGPGEVVLRRQGNWTPSRSLPPCPQQSQGAGAGSQSLHRDLK